MGRFIKLVLALLVVSGLAVAGYAWLRGREPATAGLTLIAVERGAITEKAVAVGQIEPRLKFQVKSKISGIVDKASVEVGDRVEPGDPLFRIAPDPTPAELVEAQRLVERAESAHRRADADWKRTEELARQKIVSRDQTDARRETVELARIELQRARDSLALIREGRIDGGGARLESIIRAPAAGIVLRREVHPGDPVVPLTSYQEGTALATVADMEDLIFRGTVDEIDVGKLSVGQPARLRIGALPDAIVTGRLSRIAPQALEQDNAKLFEVEIELDPTEEVFLRAGYSANADLIIRERTDTLVIPERLVLFEDDGVRTFVELPPDVPDAEPRRVEIETGLSDGLQIEVLSGVVEGQQIVQRPPREILG